MNVLENQFELKTPDLGDSEEIELVKWYKKEGDIIEKDEEVLELVTDKAAFPIESPIKGKLTQIIKKNGTLVQKEEVLGILEI